MSRSHLSLAGVVGCLVAVGLLGACQPEDDSVFARRNATTRAANATTLALVFEDGEVVPATCERMTDDGPALHSVAGPISVLEGREDSLYLVTDADLLDELRSVTLTVVGADRRIDLPAAFDPETGAMEIPFHWRGVEDDLDDELAHFRGQFRLVDRDGRCGSPLTAAFGHYETNVPGRFNEVLSHVGATLSNLFVECADGTFFLSGGADGTIVAWDISTGRKMHTFRGHTGGVVALAATRDGRWLVSGGKDNTARLWDLDTGLQLYTFGLHLDSVEAVALSPDDSVLALGSWDGTVQIWDLAKQEPITTLEVGSPVNALEFAESGTFLAAGSGRLFHAGALDVWSTSNWENRYRLDFEREVTALGFDRDQDRLAIGFGRGAVQIRSVLKGELLLEFVEDHADTVVTLVFLPADSDTLALVKLNGHVTIRDATTGAVRFEGHTATAMTSSAVSRSGLWVSIGREVGSTRLEPLGTSSLVWE